MVGSRAVDAADIGVYQRVDAHIECLGLRPECGECRRDILALTDFKASTSMPSVRAVTRFFIEVPRGRSGVKVPEAAPPVHPHDDAFLGLVLVIEDEASLRSALARLLKKKGVDANVRQSMFFGDFSLPGADSHHL
jgi:hypothetical protein